jgi:hypothetical protein
MRQVSIAGLLTLAALTVLTLSGCARRTPPAAPPPQTKTAVTYTVPAAELENPDNKPVYVCPMEEHKDQVSLDPEAHCKLCDMKVIPLEEAKKAWAGSAEMGHAEHEPGR